MIEDGSQALGSTYRGRRVGAIGDVAAFCVHVRTRSMALRAGIITTNHQGLAETMQALSSTGEDAWLEDDADPVAQVMSCANIPGRIDSDLAVCTIPDLRRLDGLLKIRRRYARMYSSRLKNVAAFSVPFVWPDVRHAWQVYALTLHRERLALDYDGFVEALRGENIQVKAHSLPVHLHPDYRLASELRRGELPVAERLAGSSILLPLTEIMTERDVRGVIAALERVAARYRLQARE